ncbi:hypothetical protein SAMN06297129_2133 [Pseudooceanicola antarcticus]|uniref:Histidine kinase n=1 Tax=Pseudooceanicola antarcticus TaxID=1247613 RepID=A0A285ITX1_9RHOB|nr:DUF6446 family protein [Pseudooceanicola antarcticus]PJE32073.1 histidine kinase [Pseudooceanicola antarcticus]SNY51459.1 hypothetical protein SAMN06297129_2133 [Pseudooceanicola antarcticus]
MLGRILIVALLLTAVVAGGSIYYLQEYAYYETLSEERIIVTDLEGALQELPAEGIAAIDANSSPIRYRACFTTDLDTDALAAFEPYPEAEPLQGPRWFDCYDAGEIGAALEEGRATAYLSQRDVTYGIDRVLAIDSDGRGWVWHQINRCGEEVFDGHPAPEGCPPVPEGVARQ